jgi:putative colanic acid biosysnthesis UDP-glucose lipid carrier transferase
MEKELHPDNLSIPYFKGISSILNAETASTPLIIFSPLDIPFYRIIKRLTDIFISVIIIITILSWMIPLLGILIMLDSKGPVFFLQKRNKKNGALFTCIKFRSMILNNGSDLLPAAINDKRITRIGKFMREHYLDELPQFFNVLMGDMSVVGPRPHMISENLKFEEQIRYYYYRHKIKPGITGLAQVTGYAGPVTDFTKIKRRVNMDIFSVRHWSSKLDMIILIRTVYRVLGL